MVFLRFNAGLYLFFFLSPEAAAQRLRSWEANAFHLFLLVIFTGLFIGMCLSPDCLFFLNPFSSLVLVSGLLLPLRHFY